jgi:hypothetical protein
VLAIDYVPAERTGFAIAAKLLDSRVAFRHANFYHLDPRELGTFDLVLFLGLLYHLPDPVGALRLVRSLCRSRLYLETLVIDQALLLPHGSEVPLGALDDRLAAVPMMQFFPGAVRSGDPTNFWGRTSAASRPCSRDGVRGRARRLDAPGDLFEVRRRLAAADRGVSRRRVRHPPSMSGDDGRSTPRRAIAAGSLAAVILATSACGPWRDGLRPRDPSAPRLASRAPLPDTAFRVRWEPARCTMARIQADVRIAFANLGDAVWPDRFSADPRKNDGSYAVRLTCGWTAARPPAPVRTAVALTCRARSIRARR